MSIKIGRGIEIFFILGIMGGVAFSLSSALAVTQDSLLEKNNLNWEDSLSLVQGNSLLASSEHYYPVRTFTSNSAGSKRIKVVVTAYSSSRIETDSDPYITASGQWVRDGIVAANFLPFGTKIKIPELFGDKVFVVQDRMHPRKKYQVDIWFSSRQEAMQFGAHYSYIELLEKD